MVCEKLKFQLLKRARFVRGARAVAFLFLLSFVFGIPFGVSSASSEIKYFLNKDIMAAIQNQIETIEKLAQETQDQAKEKFLSYFRLVQFVDSGLSFLEFADVEKDGKLKEELTVQREQIFKKARALLFFEKDHEIVTSSFLYFLIIHFYERLWNEDGVPGNERSLHEEALSKTLGFSSKEEMYEFKRLISDFFKSLPVFEQFNEKIDFLLKVHLEAKRLDERPLAPSPYLKELESENKEFREFVEHLWRETRIVTYLEFVSGSKSFGVPRDKGIDMDLYLGLRGRAEQTLKEYRALVDRYFPKLRGER